MRSALQTLETTTPFMYAQQGYYSNLRLASPLADGSFLLPFISKPYPALEGVLVTAQIISVCGNYSDAFTGLELIYKNNTLTIYWSATVDSLVTVPQGYYYVLVNAAIAPNAAVQAYDNYIARVQADGGVVESGQCVFDRLVDLAGGYIDAAAFKTEPFYMPDSNQIPERQGSFNQSFSTAFDV